MFFKKQLKMYLSTCYSDQFILFAPNCPDFKTPDFKSPESWNLPPGPNKWRPQYKQSSNGDIRMVRPLCLIECPAM